MASAHVQPPFRDSPPPYEDIKEGEWFKKIASMLRKFIQTSARSQSINPPPTYDDYIKEVEWLIQHVAAKPEFKRYIEETVQKTASFPDKPKAIYLKSMDQFTAKITKTNAAFEDIRAKLHAVDQLGLKDRKWKIGKGVRRWIGLRDKWSSLLQESQDIARKSVIRCDDLLFFCNGVLEIKSVDDPLYKDTITELEIFTKTPDPAGRNYNPDDVAKQATIHSQAFWDLKEELTDFRSDFDDFARYQGTHNDPIIKDLDEKIQVIERKIAFDVQVIMSLGVALKVTGLASLVGGVITAVPAPLGIGAIIALIISALVASEECALRFLASGMYKTEEQRVKWQGGLKEVKALKEALKAARSKLEDPNDCFGFILSQVDLLKNVGYTISHEAYLITSRLKAATNKKTLTSLQAQIKAVKGTYEQLRDILDKYGRTI